MLRRHVEIQIYGKWEVYVFCENCINTWKGYKHKMWIGAYTTEKCECRCCRSNAKH